MKTTLKPKPLKGKLNLENNISFENVDIIGNPGSSIDSITFDGNGIISSTDSSGIRFPNPIGITSEYYLGERIEMSTSFVNLNSNITTSFINVSSNVNLFGSIQDSEFDFFIKTITITGCNSSLNLQFPSGKLITPDNNSSAKTITLNQTGQGVTLIFDKVNSVWYLKDAGVYSIT